MRIDRSAPIPMPSHAEPRINGLRLPYAERSIRRERKSDAGGAGERPLPWLERFLGVAELALGGLEHAGAVLVLALVAADSLDAGVVSLGEHGTDFLHS